MRQVIEEPRDMLPIHACVMVSELGISGRVYERGVADSGHSVYGIVLTETAFPKNFVATNVWHCRREDLSVR